jgi:hypothetical protein
MMRRTKSDGHSGYPGFNPDTWYGMDTAPEDERVDLWCIPMIQNSSVEIGTRVPDCLWNGKASKDWPKVGWYYCEMFNGPERLSKRFVEQPQPDGTVLKPIAWRFRPVGPQVRMK